MTISVTVKVSGALKATISRNGKEPHELMDDAKGGTKEFVFILDDGENSFSINQGSQTKGVDNDNLQGGDSQEPAEG